MSGEKYKSEYSCGFAKNVIDMKDYEDKLGSIIIDNKNDLDSLLNEKLMYQN
jgi:hypothetical protein